MSKTLSQLGTRTPIYFAKVAEVNTTPRDPWGSFCGEKGRCHLLMIFVSLDNSKKQDQKLKSVKANRPPHKNKNPPQPPQENIKQGKQTSIS